MPEIQLKKNIASLMLQRIIKYLWKYMHEVQAKNMISKENRDIGLDCLMLQLLVLAFMMQFEVKCNRYNEDEITTSSNDRSSRNLAEHLFGGRIMNSEITIQWLQTGFKIFFKIRPNFEKKESKGGACHVCIESQHKKYVTILNLLIL